MGDWSAGVARGNAGCGARPPRWRRAVSRVEPFLGIDTTQKSWLAPGEFLTRDKLGRAVWADMLDANGDLRKTSDDDDDDDDEISS